MIGGGRHIEDLKEIIEEPKQKIGQWIESDYNKLYVHSVLNDMSPEEFEELYLSRIPLRFKKFFPLNILILGIAVLFSFMMGFGINLP